MRPYPAECFLGDAQVRGDHAQRGPLDQGWLLFHQLLIAFSSSGKMQVIKALLQLDDSGANDQAAHPFKLVVLPVQFFQLVMVQNPQPGGFQQLNAPAVGLPIDKAHHGAGKCALRTQPIGYIFAFFKVKSSGKSAFNKINMVANSMWFQKQVPFWCFLVNQDGCQGRSGFGSQLNKFRYFSKECFQGCLTAPKGSHYSQSSCAC